MSCFQQIRNLRLLKYGFNTFLILLFTLCVHFIGVKTRIAGTNLQSPLLFQAIAPYFVLPWLLFQSLGLNPAFSHGLLFQGPQKVCRFYTSNVFLSIVVLCFCRMFALLLDGFICIICHFCSHEQQIEIKVNCQNIEQRLYCACTLIMYNFFMCKSNTLLLYKRILIQSEGAKIDFGFLKQQLSNHQFQIGIAKFRSNMIYRYWICTVLFILSAVFCN